MGILGGAVDRKNPSGYSTKDLERMDRKNSSGYSAKNLEQMDKKNPSGNLGALAEIAKGNVTGAVATIVKPKQVVSPTTAELSQSEAANADSYDLRKTKRKGRSATIMTGPAGAKNEDLVLGKPTLLGS